MKKINMNYCTRMLLCLSFVMGMTNQKSAATSSTETHTNVSCFGGNNGSGTVTGTCCSGSYTYQWVLGGVFVDGATQTGLTAGTYQCVVGDAGTHIIQVIIISQPSSPISATSSSTSASCGTSNGSATVTASGGTPGYTYSWAPSGGTSNVATGLAAGSYTCTITDANGCIKNQVVTVNTAGTTVTGTSTVCPTGNVTLTTSASGGTWSTGNAAVATVNSSGVVTGVSAGTAVISYTTACNFGVKLITVISAPTVNATIGGTTTVVTGGTTTLTNSTSGGTWSSSAPAIGSISTGGVVTGISIGTTLISYTKSNTCGATAATVNVAVISSFSATQAQTNVSCNSSNDGTASVTVSGGTTPYSYSWAGGSADGLTTSSVSGLSAGSYTCTITDALSATITKTFTISEPAALTASISASTNIACNGISSGSATVSVSGGTLSYSYSWAPVGGTAATATGLAAGTYTVTITDANSCVQTQTVTLTEPAAFTSSVSSITNVSCNGLSNGAATISAGGGVPSYSYSWAPGGGSAATATGLAAGTYTVTITDANTCSRTETVAIAQPSALVISSISSNAPVCVGNSLNLSNSTTGGTAPLVYSWSGPNSFSSTAANPSIPSVTTAAGGTYTLSITDANSCTATGTHTTAVTVNLRPVISSIGNNGPVCATSNLTFTSTAGAGQAPYSYAWSGPNSFSSTAQSPVIGVATTAATGVYTLSVTDANGCATTVSSTTSAVVNPRPAIGSIGNNGPVCTGVALTFNSSASGGTGSLTYAWSGPISYSATGASPSISSAAVGNTGVYTLTVTDGLGCHGTGVNTTSATVNPRPVVSAVGNNGPLCANNTLNLTSTSTGGTAPLSYAWSGPNSFSATSSNPSIIGATTNASGIYMLTVTDVNNCSATGTHTTSATVNPSPATITGNNSVCEGLTITLSNATGTGTWSSSNPSVATITSGGVVTGVSAGATTISYILSTGCYITKDVTVNPIPATISGPTSICAGANITMSTTPSGGTWSSTNTTVATIDINTGVVTGVNAGTTNITYTTDQGCVMGTAAPITNPMSSIVGNTGTCTGLFFTLTDATTGGTWSSSNTSVVNIGATSGLVQGVSGGVATVTYTIGSCYRTQPMTISSAPPAITGNTDLCIGNTSALSDAIAGGTWSSSATTVAMVVTATGVVTGIVAGTADITYALSPTCKTSTVVTVDPAPVVTGNTIVCLNATNNFSSTTTGGNWISSNSAVASVDASGNVTGVATGVAGITYTVGTGCYKVTMVTVSPLPAAVSGVSLMCVNGMTVFTDLTPGGVLWSSSNTAVATIGSASGLTTGIAPGTTVITYTLGTGCMSTTLLTVNALPTAIAGIPTVCMGLTTALSSSPAGGVWTSANAAIASVDASGLVSGNAGGIAPITYTQPGVGCIAAVNVTVNSIPNMITGAISVCAGSSAALSSSTSGGTWTSGNTSVATIDPVTGIVTGVSIGTAPITYMLATGCQATKTVTVTTGNPITGTMTVCPGLTTALSNAASGGMWTSNNTAIATINSASGMVAGLSAGTAVITYQPAPGCATTAIVTVATAPVSITGTTNVTVNNTITLSDATGGGAWSSSNSALGSVDATTGVVTGISAGNIFITYAIGSCYKTHAIIVNPLPNAITGNPTVCMGLGTNLSNSAIGLSWTSSNPAVATIGSSSGIVFGVSPGTTVITFTALTGSYVTTIITVNPQPGASVGPTNVCPGATITLSNSTAGGTWSSSNAAYASVNSSTGVVTGIFNGTAMITYSLNGCSAVKVVSVNTVPNAISGPTLVCLGYTTSLIDGTAGGAWSSAASGVATISASGTVTPVSPGTATVSYTMPSGCAQTTVVTVNNMTANTGAATACTGAATTLANASPGGVWTASPTSIATVNSSTGVVTGVATGSVVVTYSLTAGCRALTTVNVLASPANVGGPTSVCVNAAITLTDATGGGTWSSGNPALATVVTATGVVTGLTAGTPSIIYTAANGCTKSANITVKALPAPIAGNTAICIGGTVTVTDPSPTGVSWTSGNTAIATVGAGSGLVTGISAGNVDITYLNNTGCSVTKTVTVSAPATAGTVTGPLTVSKAASIALPVQYSDVVPGGTWSISSAARATINATTGMLTGVSGGAVTVSYRAPSGCYAVLPITITTPKNAGNTATEDAVATFDLYPNPTTGTFNINSPAAGSFSMYTLEGREVERYNVTAGANTLNVAEGLASGIYICRFNGEDGTSTTVRLVYKP